MQSQSCDKIKKKKALVSSKTVENLKGKQAFQQESNNQSHVMTTHIKSANSNNTSYVGISNMPNRYAQNR